MAYALDKKTQKHIDRLARHWGVTKSEALRRAVQIAVEEEQEEGGLLRTLEELRIVEKGQKNRAAREESNRD